MMNTQDPPNTTPTPSTPPQAGASFHESQIYINERSRHLRAKNPYLNYSLQSFLKEMPPLPPKEALKHEYLLNSFSDQLEFMNLSMQYCLYHLGEDGLDKAIYLQRRFCETVRLMHKIKTDNRSRKDKKSKPVTP